MNLGMNSDLLGYVHALRHELCEFGDTVLI